MTNTLLKLSAGKYVPKDFSKVIGKSRFNIIPIMTTRGCPYNFDFCCVTNLFYYDPNTYQGKLNLFYKSDIYKHQNEVRLQIQNAEEKPFEFYIGEISDISRKIPVSDLD